MIRGDRGVRKSRVHFAVLACALVALLAVPAFAAAAEYEVNSLLDGSATTGCETPGPTTECTLRGAIAAANANADKDVIKFEPILFDGEAPEATIAIGSPLVITEPVEIRGGGCVGGWTPLEGPCAEITGLPSSAGGGNSITVEASDVKIEGLAVDGGDNGIVVAEGKTGFTATNDWFGTGLNPFSGTPIFGIGIRLEPGADNAVVGGEAETDRDVFRRGEVGVFVDGASSAAIKGNYFGLKPDGTYQSGTSLSSAGVRIVDSTAPVSKAENNEVGGLREAGAKSAECDRACNVFATDGGSGIVLESATGPTVIRGNYLGLSPDGSGPNGSRSNDGIVAGPSGPGKPGPGEVTIGGPTAATEGNLFVEGEYGMKAEGAEALEVVGNKFGYTSDGEEIEDGRAEESAISVSSKGLAAAALESNSINAEGSGGIESLFAGSEIVGNDIVGGTPAILTRADTGGVGNVITGNTLTEAVTTGISIENSANVISANTITKAGKIGIEVERDGPSAPPFADESNVVVGNVISEAVEIGIEVGSNATHNRIGGDGAGEANTITKSGGAGARDGAITIVSRQEGRNEVAANAGSGNSPRFIKLISHGGPEEPNGGIKPPALATVLQSSATGTAQPDATVRIFGKASPETGELGALLKVVKADAAGNWSAAYGTVGVGTLITATQTSTEGATSELATAVAASADPSKPEEPKSSPQPPPPVTQAPPPKAPKVKITAGPKKSSTATTAKFKFKAEPAAGAKFECKLDGARWAKCSSPKTYKKLKPGKHTFQVRATADGLEGSATKFKFTVKP